MGRQQDLDRLYPVLDSLAQRVGGPRKRKNCTDYMDWPDRGVYFSSNRGSVANRPTSHASRGWARTRCRPAAVPRSGTGSNSTTVPAAPAATTRTAGPTAAPSTASVSARPSSRSTTCTTTTRPGTNAGRVRDRAAVRDEEYILERRVSAYIREQPFIWVDIDDEPGPRQRPRLCRAECHRTTQQLRA